MKNFLALVLLLGTFSLQAQNIKGKVCMEKDKSPAQFASVGLIRLPDSTIVTGVITLTDGGYSFDAVKPGNYFIKVSFLGYQMVEKEITVQEISTTPVDTIFLSETSTSLDEVTIVGESLK
jgi:hypothetical protein